MMFFANPCGPAVLEAMRAGQLGFIKTPEQGNRIPDGVVWCADNGAFSDKFDEAKWWRSLVANAHIADRCLFAVAPDVVGDAYATTLRSRPWLGRIRELGYPVAYVAQDGIEKLRGRTADGGLTFPVPWESFDVLFIGGSTEFKLGPIARELAAEAKSRGKHIHVGRVNSERRWRYCAAPYPYGLGADSVDGTKLVFGVDANLPHVLAWTRNNDQHALFEGGV